MNKGKRGGYVMITATRPPIRVIRTLLSLLIMVIAATVALAQPATSNQNQFINILTAGTGGVFYPLGGALSNIFAAKIPGTKPSVQSTKGSVENLNLLQQGRAEIAFTQGDALAFAWAGDADAGFKSKFDTLRGIAAIYPSYIHIVALKESGIKTIADLKGKRLSVGAPRSGTELDTRTLLRAAGIDYKDLGKAVYLPFEESVDLMKNIQLDATLQVGGLGIPAVLEIANAFSVVFVEVPSGVVAKAGVPYATGTIPKDTYRGQDSDVPTATLLNYVVTRSDLPADLVYNMTKAIFDSIPELVAAHPAAASIKLERALDGMPVPLHPGAQKYFREKGLIK
jgi:TRAP transporter TAXI family solute receptor